MKKVIPGRTNPSGFMCGTDGNEELCGTCQIAWTLDDTLICCERCPAAYHPDCAGYADLDDVPIGDWYCWSCSKKMGDNRFFPVQPYRGDGIEMFVASDQTLEVFYKARVIQDLGNRLSIEYQVSPRKTEVLDKRDHRIWCGTVAEYAWQEETDGAFRPKCRAYEIDPRHLRQDVQADSSDALRTDTGQSDPAQAQHSSKPGSKVASKHELEFMAALQSYWKRRGQELPAYNPVIDLLNLWKGVESYGGYESVQNGQLWGNISELLDPDALHPMLPFLAKTVFRDVLLGFEAIGGLDGFKRATDAEIKASGSVLKRRNAGASVPVKLKVAKTTHHSVAGPSNQSSGHQTNKALPSVRLSVESKSAVGLVELTDEAKNLVVGDWVEGRSMDDGFLGAWFLGEINAIAPGGPWEGYRRFHIRWLEFDDRPQDWVPMLSRGNKAGAPFPSPVVMVRKPQSPLRPAVVSDDSSSSVPYIAEGMDAPAPYKPKVGDRVEAWWEGGWWMASVVAVKADCSEATVQGDPLPLGMGMKWDAPVEYIRAGHPQEEHGLGMVQPPKQSQMLTPTMLAAHLASKRKGQFLCFRCAEQVPI